MCVSPNHICRNAHCICLGLIYRFLNDISKTSMFQNSLDVFQLVHQNVCICESMAI